jgi:inner membrane protein
VDPLTHTLTGVVAANAFFRRRLGPPAVPILALAANLPDLDVAVHLTGDPVALTMRRTFGHSLLLIPLWSLALGLALRTIWPRIPLRTHVGLALLGCGIHVVFDLVNSFGVVVLWPLRGWRPELATVFIVDLVLTSLLALPLLIALPRRARPHLAALSRAAAAAAALYLVLCGAGRMLASARLAAETSSRGSPPAFSYVFPEPLGPHRWRGVAREGDVYRLYLIHPLTGLIEARGEERTDEGNPIVERARASPEGRRLEQFFKAPVWTLEKRPGGASGDPAEAGAEAAVVRVHDLRFRSLVLDRPAVFEYTFDVPAGGAARVR